MDGPCVVPFQNYVWQPHPSFKMAAVIKNINFFNCLFKYCCFMRSNFNCCYIVHGVFSCDFFLFFQPINTNYAYFILREKYHIKICSEIWAEMAIGSPTFRIICDILTTTIHAPSKMAEITNLIEISSNGKEKEKKNRLIFFYKV